MEQSSLLKSFLVWSVWALLIIWLYNLYCNYQTDRKVDKAISIIGNPCQLPDWVQEKIEETYTNIVSFKCVNE